MDKKQALSIVLDSKYYTVDDLRYNKNAGFLFSKDEFLDFIVTKNRLISENCEYFKKLPLKTFNSPHCFFAEGSYLLLNINEYLSTLMDDYKQNKTILFARHMDDILNSRVFSEIEGTLNIENVPTTHKRIKEIYNSEKLTDKNDVIIKNMTNAIKFIVKEKPAFNKENLKRLYQILSENCLDEEDRLQKDAYYRHDAVSIGGFEGAPFEQIDELMDSLFNFVADSKNRKEYDILLPHICHYYVLYVHPYFDYNGRTARMVSFWISVIYDISVAPLFISEAINEFKSDYYRALTNTRNMSNDLTYFLGFILETSTKFSLIYKNIEEIKKKLSISGDFLSSSELVYLKKILIHNPENYFNCKMFLEYINNNMSKQGAFKILNSLTGYGILTETVNKKKEKIYKVNPKYIVYTIK